MEVLYGNIYSALLSVFIISIMELIIFFYLAVPDAQSAIKELKEKLDNNSEDVPEQLRSINPFQPFEDYYESKKRKFNSSLGYLSLLIPLVVFIILIYSSKFVKNKKPYIIMSMVTVVVLVIFKLYFYYEVAKKWNYQGHEEMVNDIVKSLDN